MFKNYLKTTLRNLLRNKVFSFINLLGLTIGLSACLLILQYIQNEISYDQFYPEAERLFRVVRLEGTAESNQASTSPALGPTMAQFFPEIEAATRIHRTKGIIQVAQQKGETKAFREENVYFAEANFLKVMGYTMRTKGDITRFLDAPNTVVISKTAAARYFGGGNPVGETLVLVDYNFGKKVVKVTGVFQDLPPNAHLQFNILFSLSTIKNNPQEWAKLDNWSWTDFYTYLRLKPGATAESLQAKFPPVVKQLLKKLSNDPNQKLAYQLQNIRDIHLHSQLQGEPGVNGNVTVVRFLGILSLFVLILAWVNYINLSTARSLDRAKEVGIRKVVGAYRSQLIGQFLLEAWLLNLVALGVSVFIVDTTFPWFSQISGQSLEISLWKNSQLVLLFVSFFVLGTFLSGAYPAFVLSRFNPVKVLKGRFINSAQGNNLRKTLVVVQFTISIVLVIGTYAVYQQLNFMRNKDLGFNKDQMMVVKGPALTDATYGRKAQLFRQALLKHPLVNQVAYSNSIPAKSFNWGSNGFKRNLSDPDNQKSYSVTYIDQHFIKTYQMRFLAGSVPTNLIPYYQQKGVIINEDACKLLGFASPAQAIDQVIYQNKKPIKVLGVLKNYHHYSLKSPMVPSIMFFDQTGNYCSIKITPINGNQNNYQQMIQYAQKQYEGFFGGNPFQYFFVDQNFALQYKADQQFGQVFALFSLLAILIACLGLFGLSLYTIQQKNKEIGIRKILGASGNQILRLLSQSFLKLILIAYLIGLPVTYWAIHEWLKTYSYAIDIYLGLFLIPAIAILLLASLTIAHQTFKAIRANPVDILRYE
ncbi:MAG TPA: ABC transporter permease [Microscillaceae bacterium]|nr:ABC transporter permease [Microscillaceae bacterium]